MQSKVLVIDDDKDLCRLIAKNLAMEGLEVSLAHDGRGGLNQALAGDWQLIVLDVMLPELGGFDLLAELRKSSAVPVLLLTALDSEPDVVAGLRLGADDYLSKPFGLRELAARASALIRRYTRLNVRRDSAPVKIGGLSLDPDRREASLDGANLDLTAREFDLLLHLAENRGRVSTKKEIYSQVWKDEYVYDDNTISVHIRRLRAKLEADPAEPKLILTVRGIGYRLADDSQ